MIADLGRGEDRLDDLATEDDNLGFTRKVVEQEGRAHAESI